MECAPPVIVPANDEALQGPSVPPPLAPPLSVIMPAYNEEAALEAAVREVEQCVLVHLPEAELVVINDGSRDRTGAILDRLAAANPRIRPLHQANGGHGRALRAGLDAARGDFVFLIDSDRQIPLEAFGPLWQEAKERDGGFGIRANRHDPWLRLKLTALVRRVLPLLFGVRIRDANIPFKIVRRSAWLQAQALIPADTLAPSLFLAIFLRRGPFKLVEKEVPHRERQTGVVSIRRWKLFKFCCRAFVQLLAFRWRLARWPGKPAS